MAILFRKHLRPVEIGNPDGAKKVFPTITYKYTNSALLKEVAREISANSGVTEGNAYSVLKDFRTTLRKLLLSGRTVNIEGLGYFYLSAQSKGTDTMEAFTANDITGLRICFRANNDIRIVASGSTRSDGLVLKDVDRIDDESYIQACQQNSVKDSLNRVTADSESLFTEINESLSSLNALAEGEGQGELVVPYSSYVQTLASQLAILPRKFVSSLTRLEDNKIHIDLNEMIMYVLRICQKTFPHTINIEVALNESKSWVFADPAQLAELFLSFMDNAADAMTSMKEKRGDKELGGILSVSIEKVTGDKVACDTLIRFRQSLNEPSYWIIIISDTGVGIAPEDQKRIFDPFFTTKDNPANKGLGLTHALTTINSLGGCVDVNSKPGRGTIFKIYIPETDNAASKSNDAATDASLDADEKHIPHGSGLVLLVDEDSMMRKVTRKLLEKIGYSVIDTDNGFSALNLYAENLQEVACVLLDVTVPQMTNYDIYMSLKGMNPDVNVIVFPDSDHDESIGKLRKEGFSNFIRKPISLEMLAKMMQRLISTPANGN